MSGRQSLLRIWRFSLLMLMLLSSLPRFGCICVDGTHLPYCQKMARNVFMQVKQLFRSSTQAKVCDCCGHCTRQDHSSIPGSEDSSEPCQCVVTVEGPLQSSPPRDSFDPGLDVLYVIPAETHHEFNANSCESVLRHLHQKSLPSPALAGMVRLNI